MPKARSVSIEIQEMLFGEFGRLVVGVQKIDGPASELELTCGHHVVMVDTGNGFPKGLPCGKCRKEWIERQAKIEVEALCR